jgi:hypothetical protein
MYAMKYTREQLGNHVGFPFTFPPEHLELYPSIKSIEGMDGYVECLDSYRGIILDHITAPKSTFHTVSLEGASFIQANLQGTDFSQSNVSGAFFDGADLSETKWANGNMIGTSFVEAKLTKVNMGYNRIHGADFRGAIMVGADMGWGDNFHRCSFHTASLERIEAECETFQSCDFTQANLRGAIFKSCTFNLCDFTQADLTGVSFEDCIMYVGYFRDTVGFTHEQAEVARYWDVVDGERGYQAIQLGWDQRKGAYDY